jgi:hypothetical protein
MVPWNAARAKVQIKLSIQRLRTLQEKKLALAKKSRRDIADLLQKNRTETARLRVEGLIQDDIYVELLELLEVSGCVEADGLTIALCRDAAGALWTPRRRDVGSIYLLS